MNSFESYYAVIFTSTLTNKDVDGYYQMAEQMEDLAKQQPGYLGFESARGKDGLGISVSYWADESSVQSWKHVLEHTKAQQKGISDWYQSYSVRVAKVERAYAFSRESNNLG